MKLAIIFFAVLLTATAASAQSVFRAAIQNEETKQAIGGAKVSVRNTDISATTDKNGKVELKDIPDGEQAIEVFAEGYEIQELILTFPQSDETVEKLVLLEANETEVVVSTTRTGREIDDAPTRVEAIDEEEVDEKMNMRPANISMVLHESTGIQVQQTSATSFTQSIRIQGLDGRYTQILKDGFPAYGGFSGSLSVLEIPPLDLKQVEIIKGASSTFYGAGAIAGVVNFISKTPENEPVTSLIFNQTSALGTDFSIYNSQKFERFGYTFLGSVNYQKEYDADDDDFTELPLTKSFNINPRLFYYIDDKTSLTVGNTTSYQNRKGGDKFVIRGQADGFHQYFENNNSFRNITTVQLDREFSGGKKIVARQSLAFFNREIETPVYLFEGKQFNAYTDITYFHPIENHALILGFTAVYDQFREDANLTNPIKRDETRTTFGGYVQDTFDLTNKLSLEAGFRLDAVKDYGVFALPRVSLHYRFNDNLSSRVSFGLGYKPPSVFTEDAETLLFQNVLPIGDRLKAERSLGGTFDINYRNTIGESFSYSINQLFFYTEISDPLVLEGNPSGIFSFRNADSKVRSRGIETNAKFIYNDFVKLFLGYTFTDAKAEYLAGNQFLTLVPKHKINSALLFEKERDFKTGIEAYYTGKQFLSDGFKTKDFFEVGFFAEKTFGKYSIFFNAENLTDVRQSRYTPVVFPPHQTPTFAEIYTHTEGRVFNGGIKIRF